MSTDLTFITNEKGRSLADRFSVLLGKNTRAFDCLVGYFYLSGFRRLADALKPTEKVRILIGLSTDQPTNSAPIPPPTCSWSNAVVNLEIK